MRRGEISFWQLSFWQQRKCIISELLVGQKTCPSDTMLKILKKFVASPFPATCKPLIHLYNLFPRSEVG